MAQALRFCPYCGSQLLMEAQQFCAACGRRLAPAADGPGTVAATAAPTRVAGAPSSGSPDTRSVAAEPTQPSNTVPSETSTEVARPVAVDRAAGAVGIEHAPEAPAFVPAALATSVTAALATSVTVEEPARPAETKREPPPPFVPGTLAPWASGDERRPVSMATGEPAPPPTFVPGGLPPWAREQDDQKAAKPQPTSPRSAVPSTVTPQDLLIATGCSAGALIATALPWADRILAPSLAGLQFVFPLIPPLAALMVCWLLHSNMPTSLSTGRMWGLRISLALGLVAGVFVLAVFGQRTTSYGFSYTVSDVAQPAIGLWLYLIACAAGLVFAFRIPKANDLASRAASSSAGGSDVRVATPVNGTTAALDLGSWLVVQRSGYSVTPGDPITLRVENTWVEVKSRSWLRSFPCRPEHVLAVDGTLEFRDRDGSVTLRPAGGQNVALIRSLIIPPG